MKDRRIRTAAIVLLFAPLVAACPSAGAESNGKPIQPPGPGDVPEKVHVPASTLTSGVTIGQIRRTNSVDAFEFAKYPVTAAQFSACVSAGGCAAAQEKACLNLFGGSPLDRSTVGVSGADALPATCVGIAQAKAYCAWAGGKLPTLPQFLLAARGADVARFAWGNTSPTCAQRADARASTAREAAPCTPSGNRMVGFAVGKHPAGASTFGVEDVLLSPGELVDVSNEAYSTACVAPHGACIAYGDEPGAIDGFEPVNAVEGAMARHGYGFRCAWN